MKTSDFDYYLPRDLIAQTPTEPRDHSRLMVVSRMGNRFSNHRFYNLPRFLQAGDVLVVNNTRVLPARIYGAKDVTDAKIELLLLNQTTSGLWRALVKPGRRMRQGSKFRVPMVGNVEDINGEVISIEDGGVRLIKLSSGKPLCAGTIPLPPYITVPLQDQERYQTVYGDVDGSIAAPTAGLHFTSNLLGQIQRIGVEIAYVTLHVGWDSFRPINTDDPIEHKMHSEFWNIETDSADIINRAKREGRRIISVGTTAVRVLEAVADFSSHGYAFVKPGSGWTSLYILPGYKFKIVDALVTNFHLPGSTLLMLTCAFAGQELILRAYEKASSFKYRFYSFGDAMLIL